MTNKQREVISFMRVACGDQATGAAAIEMQRKANQKTTNAFGLTIRREILLIGVSGHQVQEHPEFQALLADFDDPTLAGIVLSDILRLVRPAQFADLAILAHFQRKGKSIFVPGMEINPASKDGSLVLRASLMPLVPVEV